MGMIDTVRNRIKSVFSRERTNIERATDLSVGAQPVGFDTASIYGRYGIEPLVDYLRIEQELVSRYMDYNEMCVYPELSAALECYADESCQFDILTGRTVWVESDDAFVKHVLQELIDKGLQLDEEIWGLSHELCKYGNCFSELLCTGEGVIGLNALPPETIRRYEKGKGILVGYAQDPRGVFGVTVEDVEKALSGHDPTATGMAYFEPWQILNMRLMGLQRQAPYGHSILESARWLWRRLLLLEDSALLYRLCLRGDSDIMTPTGVKKIKDIKKGDEVYSYTKEGKLKRTKVTYHKHNGRDKIYHVRTAHRDLYANATHPVLVEKWTNLNGKRVKVLGYVEVQNLKCGRYGHRVVMPSKPVEDAEQIKLLSPELVKKAKLPKAVVGKIVRNSTYPAITQSHGIHQYRVRDFFNGTKELFLDQAVSLLNTNGYADVELETRDDWGGNYTTNLPEHVTKEFARWFGFMLGDGYVSERPFTGKRGHEYLVREVGFAAGDDLETNQKYKELFEKFISPVKWMPDKRETNGCGKYSVSSKRFVEFMQLNGFISGAHNKRVPAWVFRADPAIQWEFVEGFIDADGHRFKGTAWIELCNKEFLEDLRNLCMQMGLMTNRVSSRTRKERKLEKTGQNIKETTSYRLIISYKKLKHTENIISVEPAGTDDIYDIGVEASEHNFVANGVTVHNTRSPQKWLFYIDVGKLPPNQALGYLRRIKNEFTKSKFVNERGSLDMRYSPLASDENLFLPVVDGKRTTEVELMATPEWQVMDDINYFRDKLFTAIRIPKAYLAAEEVSRSRTLSLEDVRFARSIMRIQRELKNGIKRLCKVHLAAMNVDPEKVNFEVFMTVPSWAYEMAQIEVRSARADFAEKVGDHLSERAILRLVFGFSDEEINALRKERKEEMREAAEAEGGGAEPEKKAPAKTEGSIMDLPRLSRVAAKDEEREDKNMHILKEKMDEMLGQNKGIAESLSQSKDFMKNLKTSIMFQPYRGQQRVVKSLGMGPRRNA
jgi:intein/homing endonuclease